MTLYATLVPFSIDGRYSPHPKLRRRKQAGGSGHQFQGGSSVNVLHFVNPVFPTIAEFELSLAVELEHFPE